MLRRSPAFIVALALTGTTWAWGPVGHRQIADICWSQLNHKSKVQIARILMAGDTVTSRRGDESFMVPQATITDAYLEKIVRPVFDEAANWCDAIKGGDSKIFESRIVADNAMSPGVRPAQDGRSGEDTRCKTWHYYDMPIANNPGAHPARDSNAARALKLIEAQFAAEAGNASPNRAKQVYCLYWIEHLFGDLHQPLHCSENFMYESRGDAGGNLFALGLDSPYRKGTKWNLHGFWDSGVDRAIDMDSSLEGGKEPSLVTAKWLHESSFLPGKDDVANLDVMSWIKRGHELAANVVYKGIQPNDSPGEEYRSESAKLSKRQALLAGFRMAAYLNGTIGK